MNIYGAIYWLGALAAMITFVCIAFYNFFVGNIPHDHLTSDKERLAGYCGISILAGFMWPVSIFIAPTYLLAQRTKARKKASK